MLGELGDLLSHHFSLVVVNLDGILLREVDVRVLDVIGRGGDLVSLVVVNLDGI